MDEKQNEWLKQFWTNHGLKEFVRLGVAITIWMFVVILLAITFDNSIFAAIFLLSLFVLPFLALRWKPGYLVYRNILGNENLPTEPMPRSTVKVHRQALPWWSYLPGIWFGLMALIALYFAIKYLLR